MSGHSKWSKVKHQKEVTDAVRGKIFTKMSAAIAIAIREGGGITNPNDNFKLRLTMEKARSVNMPKENIERVIERAKAAGGSALETVVYEAFLPGGVGAIIEATTDNHQRTVAAVKNTLDRNGGVLASSGAVSHLFAYVGKIIVALGNKSSDQLMEDALNAGAIDIEGGDGEGTVVVQPTDLHKVKVALEKAGYTVISAELTHTPTTLVPVTETDVVKRVLRLLELLEDLDDVQRVSANFDIPDSLLT
jgi:YebC/PmpR family DNA-binding regulatory protein